MNNTATTGKNLQTPELGEMSKGAYEIRLVSPSAPHHQHHAYISSSAPRQRMPVPASQPQPRTARNYGPRRLRYRWVDDLKPWQVRMLHDADEMAKQLGLPLNTFVTVNYHGTFPGGAAMASTFKKAMKRMCQWLRDHGVPIAYIYTHENPDDAKPNTHVLVHVPPKLVRTFMGKAGDWFDALDGGVDVQPRNDAQRLAQGKTTRMQYMGKGAPDLVCRNYGGRRAAGGQGPIDFKRAGVSQLLSKGFGGTIKAGLAA